MFNGTFQQKSWQPIFKVSFFFEDQSFYSSIGAMENRQAPDAFALGPPSRVSSHLADRRASGAKKKWMEDGMSRNEEGDLWNMGEYTRVPWPQLDEKGESAKCLKSDNSLEYLQGSNQEFQCDESGLICKWCKWLFLHVYNILWSSPKPLRHIMLLSSKLTPTRSLAPKLIQPLCIWVEMKQVNGIWHIWYVFTQHERKKTCQPTNLSKDTKRKNHESTTLTVTRPDWEDGFCNVW